MKSAVKAILLLVCASAILSSQTSEERLHALIQDYLLLSQAQHAIEEGQKCSRDSLNDGVWVKVNISGRKPSWSCRRPKLHLSSHAIEEGQKCSRVGLDDGVWVKVNIPGRKPSWICRRPKLHLSPKLEDLNFAQYVRSHTEKAGDSCVYQGPYGRKFQGVLGSSHGELICIKKRS